MKKKLTLIAALSVAATLALSACGVSTTTNETADTEVAESTAEPVVDEPEETSEDVTDEVEVTEDTSVTEKTEAESTEFSLSDITAESLDMGVSFTTADGVDKLLVLFTDPDGNPNVVFTSVNAATTADVWWGIYSTDSESTADGTVWTALSFTDKYSAESHLVGYTSVDSTYQITDGSGSIYDGVLLSQEDTFSVLSTAVASISSLTVDDSYAGNAADPSVDADADSDFTVESESTAADTDTSAEDAIADLLS
jgi:hypothetical protein